MAATMSIRYDFGGSDGSPGTEQDVDALGPPSIRFKSADDATIDLNDPVLIPGAGTNYSFWKQLYLYCDDPDGSTIDNVLFYSDGDVDFGTGVTLMVGDELPTKNSGSDAGYEVATGADGSGDEMVAAHADLTGSTDADNLTVGSPLTVTISETDNEINLAAETSNYVVLQTDVISTASSGDSANETLTFAYDETV
jgi:hypothetical protein